MTRVALTALVAAALAFGHVVFTAAESARLKHLASVYVDDKGVGLKRPEGVACDAKGNVVIGDTGNDRLLRFALRDRTVSGGREIRIPELSSPSTVHVNSKGEIYALDSKRRRIVRLNPDGTFKNALALAGVPPPGTIVPKSFALDASDKVHVLDAFSARVLVLDAEGTFQKALPLPEAAGFVPDLAVDLAGNVLVLDAINRQFFVAASGADTFVPLGTGLQESLTTLPTRIAVSRGVIFVVEGGGSSIVSFGRDGTFLARQLAEGWKDGSLNHPGQLCVNDKDEVFVADRDNSRVQVFGLTR